MHLILLRQRIQDTVAVYHRGLLARIAVLLSTILSKFTGLLMTVFEVGVFFLGRIWLLSSDIFSWMYENGAPVNVFFITRIAVVVCAMLMLLLLSNLPKFIGADFPPPNGTFKQSAVSLGPADCFLFPKNSQ